MRTLIPTLLLAAFAALPAAAQDVYAIFEDTPGVGSTIKRRLIGWPVPINRTYGELSPEDRAKVRAAYGDLTPSDEPPYPLRGMEPLLREVSVVQKSQLAEGLVKMMVKVDE